MFTAILVSAMLTHHVNNCDQRLYDEIYKRFVQQAITEPLTPQTYQDRNAGIKLLRQLCRGQRSTFESNSESNKVTQEGT